MSVWQGNFGRKSTGGKMKWTRKKRKYELGGYAMNPKVGEEVRRKRKTKGGNEKTMLASASFANILDPKSRASKKIKILDVVTNPANQDLARRKIITRGAVINTELGKARVTSRPSQEGIVNAVLIEQ